MTPAARMLALALFRTESPHVTSIEVRDDADGVVWVRLGRREPDRQVTRTYGADAEALLQMRDGVVDALASQWIGDFVDGGSGGAVSPEPVSARQP